MANESLKNILNHLKDREFFKNLIIRRGIEKEFFRVDKKGFISNSPHPASLGSALTNKFITTDFSEAQLELVTPVFEDINDLNDFLYSLHVFVGKNISEDELLWPYSMPPKIENESDINLGYYHHSNIGLLKHVYRKGLKVRYGPTMQCVSGMHYNFSIKKNSLSKFTISSDQKVIDEAYLSLIRNFKRLYWFVLLMYGQTNVVDNSFIKNREHNLNKLSSLDMYLKDATSLRMSEIGYQSKAQKNLDIKYNSLNDFLREIKKAITVPFAEFSNKGLKDAHGDYQQISDGIIQIENEYYDSIRPKRSAYNNLRPFDLLNNFGIEYLEIRGIDISPNVITGMSEHHIRFIDLFLIYCLVIPSDKINADEKKTIDKNEQTAIYQGRNENTKISYKGLSMQIHEAKNLLIDDLKLLAEFFEDSDKYFESIEYILDESKGSLPENSFHETGLAKAKLNADILRSDHTQNINSIKSEAELSLEKLNNIPENSKEEMDKFVKNYNLNL